MIDLKHVGMFLGATNLEKQFDLFIALSHLFFKTVKNWTKYYLLCHYTRVIFVRCLIQIHNTKFT